MGNTGPCPQDVVAKFQHAIKLSHFFDVQFQCLGAAQLPEEVVNEGDIGGKLHI